MTDAKLDARLAKLSDEDLQAVAAGTWPSQIAYHFDSPKFLERMAKEILDLRMQLSARYCEDVVHLDGIDVGFATAVKQVADILDGKDSGKGVSAEPWESVRRRLLDLQMQLSARYCENIAYLEGGDDGFATAVRQVADILDGNDSGKGSSSCEPWESVRRRLLALVKEKAPCQPA